MLKRIKIAVCGIAAAFMLTGCSLYDLGTRVGNQGSWNTITDESTMTVDSADFNKLQVKNETGRIQVSKTDGNKIKIRTVKKVQGLNEESMKEVLKNMDTKAQVSEGNLEVSEVTTDGQKDFWSWKRTHYFSLNVNVEFYIEVPKDFKEYEFSNVTGNISAENLKGNIDVKNTTGDIVLKDISLKGSSSVVLTTGNIDLDVNLDETKDLKVKNITGNLSLLVPASTGFKLDAGVTTGGISGSFAGLSSEGSPFGKKVSKEFNGGGKTVTASVVTGNISVNKK